MSYTWGCCNVWLTGRQLQIISGLVPCMRQGCSVMDTVVSSIPQSRQDIRLRSINWYESATPVHFITMASSSIPARNAPGWQVIVSDFAMLATSPYLLNRPTRTFIVCCSQSGLCKPTKTILHRRLPHTAQRSLPVCPESSAGILVTWKSRFCRRCLPPRWTALGTRVCPALYSSWQGRPARGSRYALVPPAGSLRKSPRVHKSEAPLHTPPVWWAGDPGLLCCRPSKGQGILVREGPGLC